MSPQQHERHRRSDCEKKRVTKCHSGVEITANKSSSSLTTPSDLSVAVKDMYGYDRFTMSTPPLRELIAKGSMSSRGRDVDVTVPKVAYFALVAI